MAKYDFDLELPETEEDFLDRLIEAHTEGVKVGRKEGAKEIVNRVDDWVKLKYYNREVRRGSQFAQDILDLAAELVHSLIYGDLGKIPELAEPRRRPKRVPPGGEK